MSGIGPNNLNLWMLNILSSSMSNNSTPQNQGASSSSVNLNGQVQDATLPNLGLAGTPFSQPLTVGLLGTPVKQMDAQDAVSLGGGGKGGRSGEGAGESSGESSGEGAGNAGNSGRKSRKSGE